MILLDTSIWIDHLRAGDALLARLLGGGTVLGHPFVVGELALGALRQRHVILGLLQDLPEAVVASDGEVRQSIDKQALWGLGVGYVDVHLLAATRLTRGALLWTRDKRLASIPIRLGLAYHPESGGEA